MDGFTGFKTATSHELPEATAVLGPSTSSGAGDALDRAGVGSSRTCAATAARAAPTRSTAPAAPCTPAPTCSPTANSNG